MLLANFFLALGPWMVRLAEEDGVGPIAAGFWRMAFAIPLLLLLARRQQGGLTIGRGMAIVIALGGLFFAADLAAWHYGIVKTKLANATLFANLSSIIFAIYGFIAARALPRPAQGAALALALGGSALLLGSSYELSPEHLEGDLLAILAGLLYALYLIVMDRARQTLSPMPVLALATVAGALPLLVLAWAMGETVLPTDWTPLLLLSLTSQVLGQGLLVYSIGHFSPLVVGLGLLTQPAVTALIGWRVYGEQLSPADIFGGALVCAALVLIRLPSAKDQNTSSRY